MNLHSRISTTLIAFAATLFLSLFMIGIFRQVAYAAGKGDAFRFNISDESIPPANPSLQPFFTQNSFFGWSADSFSSSSGIQSFYPGLQNVQSFVIRSSDGVKAFWVEEYFIADRVALESYLESHALKALLDSRDAYYINSLGVRSDSALLLPGETRALLIHSRLRDGQGWPVEADPELTALLKRIVIP